MCGSSRDGGRGGEWHMLWLQPPDRKASAVLWKIVVTQIRKASFAPLSQTYSMYLSQRYLLLCCRTKTCAIPDSRQTARTERGAATYQCMPR